LEQTGILILHVDVWVNPEDVEDFTRAIVENARNSLKEPGVARFDVVQQQDDPTHFVIFEAYRTQEAHAAHRETAHYQTWRDAVAGMMAQPRAGVKYVNVFPPAEDW